MIRAREFDLPVTDGTVRLHASVYEAERPAAALCIAHGLGEHGGRYRALAQRYADEGFTVYVHDHRGHGRSVQRARDRGVARLDDLARDMAAMLAHAQRETGLPVVLRGHSLGGLIGLYTLMHEQTPACAGIITSPWLRLVNSPPQAVFKAADALSGLVGRISISNGIPASALSHDAAVCAAYDADPLNHDRISLGLAGSANRAANWVLAHPEALRVPLLLCHGAADPICAVQGSRDLAARASGVRYVEFPGQYHELHNEPQAAQDLFQQEVRFLRDVLGL